MSQPPPPGGPAGPPPGRPYAPPQGPPPGRPYVPAAPPQGPPPGRPYGPPPGAPVPPYQPGPGAAYPPPGAGPGRPPGAPYAPVGPPPPPGGWGYGYAPTAARPPVKHTSHTKLITLFVVGLLVVIGVFVLIANVATPTPKTQKCPPECPKPPLGAPVVGGIRYTAPDQSFSVTYPKPSDIYDTAKKVTNGVVVPIKVGDGGAVLLQGESANGQSADAVVTSYLRAKFPDARRSYVISNAILGYQPGYGEVDDIYVQSSDGTYSHERVVALAAVKNDVALLAVGIGPYHPWDASGFTNGHPSGAALLAARVMDPMINSFTWKGDPKR